VAQQGTPADVIARASEALRVSLETPEVRDKLAARGSYARPLSPAETEAAIHDQQQQWKPALERVAQQTQSK
jgi:tripartite-type tricarboxylate transporter receptor subunit TctC